MLYAASRADASVLPGISAAQTSPEKRLEAQRLPDDVSAYSSSILLQYSCRTRRLIYAASRADASVLPDSSAAHTSFEKRLEAKRLPDDVSAY